MASHKRWFLGLVACCSINGLGIAQAEAPPLEKVLARKPTQADVDYETPKPAEYSKCKLEVERKGKVNGWVVIGPSGQVLRRFLDTDGSGKLDQYRFFNMGIEVYRDIDANENDKIDQSRWLNRGGSRWGIDENEDGKIDRWKVLSAAEASREAIRAMIANDSAALQNLMVNAEDLKSLGINSQLATRLLESASDAGKKARAVMEKSKVITPQSHWSRFDALSPSTIPADDEKASEDLLVYESANAIIETPRKDPTKMFDAVQIGEMIRVGDVWKLTQVPMPIEGQSLTTSPILMEPVQIAGTGGQSTPAPSPKVEKILKELQDFEQRVLQPNQTPAAVKGLMVKRSQLLKEAMELAETEEEKVFLTKQNVDTLALTAQMGTYADGVKDLKVLEAEYAKRAPNSSLLPYITYRLIQSEYSVNSQNIDEKDEKKEKQSEIQKAWMAALEGFVEKYPQSEDADDAMFNLGNNEEYQGRTNEAVAWYQKIAAAKTKSELSARAQGALRRLSLNGQILPLTGPLLTEGNFDIGSLKGKVVLVVFWNSNFPTCVEDIPVLRALYQDNRAKGFEIVGIALEPDKKIAQGFVKTNNMTWPQIFENGGQNSPLAVSYGIISYPTMFLVGRDGKVISRNAMMTEVKSELAEILKGGTAASAVQKPNVVQNPNLKTNAQNKK